MKTGDILTIKHDCISHSGKLIHEAGQQVIVLDVDVEGGHYSHVCPDIWIPERLKSVRLVNIYDYYAPDSFYENEIGEKVGKVSLKKGVEIFNKKKFKSGRFINTIKGVMVHPKLNIPAYTFEEDDSYVECRRCKIFNKDEIEELIKKNSNKIITVE